MKRAARAFATLAVLAPACSGGPVETPAAFEASAAEPVTELHAEGPINRAQGDQSWLELGSDLEPGEADDVSRIRAHLFWVEAELRSRDVSALPFELRFARAKNLDRLHAYAEAGRFPRNEEGGARLPRFVETDTDDGEPRVCAVGWLYAEDAGVDAALAVNARFESEFVEDIDDPDLLAWAIGSGLTTDELAMIQPSYDFRRPVPVDGVEQVKRRLPALEGSINSCIHQQLKATDKHPDKVSVALQVHKDGSLAEATFDFESTTQQRLALERCFVGQVQNVSFARNSVGPKTKVTHTWNVLGPLKKDGTFNAAYLPLLTRGAAPAIQACGAKYLPKAHAALSVLVEGKLKSGVSRVERFEVTPSEDVPSTFSICARGVVAGLDVPTFKGGEVSFSVAASIAASAPVLQRAQ